MEEMVKLFLPSFFSTLYKLNSLTIILLRRNFFFKLFGSFIIIVYLCTIAYSCYHASDLWVEQAHVWVSGRSYI